MNGRCSGIPGLPAWAPCGIRTGIVGGVDCAEAADCAAGRAAGCAAAGGLEDGGLTAMGAYPYPVGRVFLLPDLLSVQPGRTTGPATSYVSACRTLRVMPAPRGATRAGF